MGDSELQMVDWRGQGLSQRPKGRTDIGHINNFFEYQIDLDAVLEKLKDRLHSKPKILFAHSMGGCIGLRSLLKGEKFDCAIFSGPLWGLPISEFTVSIMIPIFNLAISLGFGLFTYPYKIDGFNLIHKPFEKNILTRNQKNYQEMRENLIIDPRLGLGPPTLTWLVSLNTELKRLTKMPPPDIPQLTLLGEEDKVISKDAIYSRMARTPKGHLHTIPRAFHEVFFETKDIQENVWQKVDEFLELTLEKSS